MIGIIGNGFVGNAVHQNLKDKIECPHSWDTSKSYAILLAFSHKGKVNTRV